MYSIHDVAHLMPAMSEGEFTALQEDIRQNGLLEPIWVIGNQIIDGRHRYRACQALGIEPTFREYRGENSKSALAKFVVSLNLKRRHMSKWQITNALLAADEWLRELIEEWQEQAEASQKSNLVQFQDSPDRFTNVSKTDEPIHTHKKLAETVGTSPALAQDALTLKQHAPDLAEKSAQGVMGQREAMKEYKERQRLIQRAKERADLAAATEVAKSTANVRIICGRAEDQHLDAESVDIIFTSPPYNKGADAWAMGGQGRTRRENGVGYHSHDDALPDNEYIAWQLAVFAELYRVARPGASFFYNHAPRPRDGRLIDYAALLAYHPDNHWTPRQICVWDKGSTTNHQPVLFWPEFEVIYWFTKGEPALPNRPIGRSDTLRSIIPVQGGTGHKWHPAPFPEALPRYFIEAVYEPGMTILDPFMGSGTTLKVALELGCYAIGIEVSAEYVERTTRENSWW